MTTKHFSPADVTAVLDEMIQSFDSRLFPGDCPSRPAALDAEAESISDHTTTSTGQQLAGALFGIPPLHIPNAGDGANARHSYKSELTLVRDPNWGTRKIMWWHDRDPRHVPHNHPWDFRSAIISGGYTEERFWINEGGRLESETCTYSAGEINLVPANVYHNVIEVQPGTVTYLDCGRARAGNEWGYLNVDSLDYVTFSELTPENFLKTFQSLNTHVIKR